MSTIFKSFLGVFLIFTLTFIGLGISSASIDAKNADAFVTDAVANIEQSNFSDVVIQNITSNAKKQGYELSVEPRKRNGKTYMAKLTLVYGYNIPLLSVENNKHSIVSYAR